MKCKNYKNACFCKFLKIIVDFLFFYDKIDFVRGISAVGSAPHWQCGGHGFKSRMLHFVKTLIARVFLFGIIRLFCIPVRRMSFLNRPDLFVRTSMADCRKEEWPVNLPLYAVAAIADL